MKPDMGKTLLIVEDQPITRDVLAAVFRTEGYQVVTVSDSSEALTRLQSETPPDLVVLDLGSSPADEGGLLEARFHDSKVASVPLVLMSDVGIDPKWLSAPGVTGALQKPVSVDSLLALLRQSG
jgi:CheY-like chemotaxis protein